MDAIYLDNNSTTRMAPQVLDAMAPFFHEQFGNPSSIHRMGQSARHAIETAREQVAALIGASAREMVFTSGGTEADNLAIRGMLAVQPRKRHLVTTRVEHVAVHDLGQRLLQDGFRVTFIDVDSGGRLDIDQFSAALDDDTAVASVMHANNETGVIFPIEEIGQITQNKNVPLHVDAVQTVGKLEVDVRVLGPQLLSMSAHKIHGPKGVGALFVAKGVRIRNIAVGGHQERDIRPGTENVAAIVGFGAAAVLAREKLAAAAAHMAAQRDRLETGLLQLCRNAVVIGDTSCRTPNTTTISFRNLEAEAILIALSESGICASSGSACSSGSLEPSHVLQAMGIEESVAHGAVRFSVSRETSHEEIARALEIIPAVIRRLEKVQA